MDDQACPKCKTTLYRNPNMKLLVNVCGHNLCESCVDLLFLKGSGSCPECAIPLRRSNFRIQLFEDGQIDKEVDIRKRINKDFSRKEEDFDTLREYNDYLEMVEDLIYNLSNNIDLLDTAKRIADYKEKNKDFIAKNRHRQSKEALELQDILSEESMMGNFRQKQLDEEEKTQKKLKVENKEKLIDDLMFSDVDANTIVSRHEEERVKIEEEVTAASLVPKFSTGMASQNVAGQRFVEVESAPYVYQPVEMFCEGPVLSSTPSDLQVYRKHVRTAEGFEKAGGYHEDIACVRALQEGLAGLFFAQ